MTFEKYFPYRRHCITFACYKPDKTKKLGLVLKTTVDEDRVFVSIELPLLVRNLGIYYSYRRKNHSILNVKD